MLQRDGLLPLIHRWVVEIHSVVAPHNLWGVSGRAKANICGAFGDMPRVRTGEMLYIQHFDFGAVLAPHWPGDSGESPTSRPTRGVQARMDE